MVLHRLVVSSTGSTRTGISTWCWGLVAYDNAKPGSVQKHYKISINLIVMKPDIILLKINLGGIKDSIKRYIETILSIILDG